MGRTRNDARFGEVARAVAGLLGSAPPPKTVVFGEPLMAKPVEAVSSGEISTPKPSAKAGIRFPLVLGVLSVVCVIGLGWYFASRPHNPVSTTAEPAIPEPRAVPPGISVIGQDDRRYIYMYNKIVGKYGRSKASAMGWFVEERGQDIPSCGQVGDRAGSLRGAERDHRSGGEIAERVWRA